MIRCLTVLALILFPTIANGGERGLLWRVVQACVANHTLTGNVFPCLDVALPGNDASRGYAVLRAPFEDSHIIVSPTIRTIGVEADRLRAPDAPEYFHDAWISRRFVVDALPREPQRDDLGLAVNSRAGRSQDQLHIHVDCLRPDVKRSLTDLLSTLRGQNWTKVSVLPQAPRYYALAVQSEDLAGVPVFSLVANGLDIEPEAMDDTTIVVAGVDKVRGKPGFVILARQRVAQRRDLAHGEALLDHDCKVLQ